ncbi:hypothetical protein B0H10DRAFT_1940757 [Mycena sp. CBHHK59/15]|nr:hypothetical protein B0H10DRAFT_1940757 [Mycena sp. CBHHK59/15]
MRRKGRRICETPVWVAGELAYGQTRQRAPETRIEAGGKWRKWGEKERGDQPFDARRKTEMQVIHKILFQKERHQLRLVSLACSASKRAKKAVKAPKGNCTITDVRWLRALGNDVFGHGERLVTIAHLGVHNKQKHWVALKVDGPNRQFLSGDSFGKPIPPLLRQAYEWWMARHTSDPIRFGSLPTSIQTDGHSCGMLAGNTAERAVYPDVAVMDQADVVPARLQTFSRLANWVLDRIADEEEELDQASDQSSASDSEQSEHGTLEIFSPPPSFAKLARSAKFTFVSPKTEVKDLKRAKGHPDGPTPHPSPEKKRVRARSHERSPPPPLRFNPPEPSVPVDRVATPLPSHASVGRDVFQSIPISGSPALPEVKQSKLNTFGARAEQSKLGSFFKVLTKEEKAEMDAREWERLRDSREERAAREQEEGYAAKVKATAEAMERKRKSRAKQYDEKVAAGWVPAQVGRKRKMVELPDFDPGPAASSSKLAEDSRPCRQLKENARKKNKPQGRKRKPENAATVAKQVNWMNLLLWTQIDLAVSRVVGRWTQTEIVRQAQRLAPDTFAKLTPGVVIDVEARELGINKWKDSVLEKLPSGAAPGGQSTRAGILDVVEEASALLEPIEGEEAVDPAFLKLDTTIGNLCNRCVGWMVDAYHACNSKELILKAFELCAVGQFNCSQASLTSLEALAVLLELPHTNPALHLELTGSMPPPEEIENEELFSTADEELTYNDESDVPVQVVIDHVLSRGLGDLPVGFAITPTAAWYGLEGLRTSSWMLSRRSSLSPFVARSVPLKTPPAMEGITRGRSIE